MTSGRSRARPGERGTEEPCRRSRTAVPSRPRALEAFRARPFTGVPWAARAPRHRDMQQCPRDCWNSIKGAALGTQLPLPARGYRPFDRRDIRVEARGHPKEQALPDDEDRTWGRIKTRGVGEARKAVRAHAPGEPQRGEKLAPRCLHAAAAASGSELCACVACGFECWGLRFDPLAQFESSSSRSRVREARHPVCAHAVRELKCTRVGCRARWAARLVRGPAACKRDRAADGSETTPDVAFAQLEHLGAGCTPRRITAP